MKKYFKTTDGLKFSKNEVLAFRLSKLFENEKQLDVAKKLFISQPYVGQFCNGTRHPNFDTIQLISQTYGVTVDYLLGVTDDKEEIADTISKIEWLIFVYFRGVKESNISRELGLGSDWLGSHTRGERKNILPKNAIKLADKLGVSVEWLTNGKVKAETQIESKTENNNERELLDRISKLEAALNLLIQTEEK